MIPILIVEDSAVIRRLLREMIGSIEGALVAGEFDGPGPAIDAIRANPPHVVVLDIQLIDGSGLDLVRLVGKEHPQVKVIVFTNFGEPVYRQRCLDAGAYAFYDKNKDIRALRRTLQDLVSEAGDS